MKPYTPRQNKIRKFNVMLSHEERAALEHLSAQRNIPMSQCIREALQVAYTWYVNSIPCCPNGQKCHVPHMHPIQQDIQSAHNQIIASTQSTLDKPDA